jgi:hypothetical protein
MEGRPMPEWRDDTRDEVTAYALVPEDTHVLGGDTPGEAEVNRICRVLLVYKLNELITPLRTLGNEIVEDGLAGEDMAADDVDALGKAMLQLEYALQDYVEPLVDEDELTRNRLGTIRDDDC